MYSHEVMYSHGGTQSHGRSRDGGRGPLASGVWGLGLERGETLLGSQRSGSDTRGRSEVVLDTILRRFSLVFQPPKTTLGFGEATADLRKPTRI